MRDTAPMKTAIKTGATVLLLAIFGVAAYFSVYKTARAPDASSAGALSGLAGKLTGAVAVQELSGLITVEVESYFQDPRVQKVLADNGFKLSIKRIGSRDMAAKVVPGQMPDFFFPSGVVAANQIVDAAKKANLSTAVYSPIYTPLVIASWKPVAQVLQANGMATSTPEGVWRVDTAKLTQTMLDKKRWNELKGSQAYDVGKAVLVSTTDVRKSNSAAMYLALTTYTLNGSEVVSDMDMANKMALKVSGLFKRQGYQENYVNGNFDDYISIGMGKSPLAFVYESQMLSYALARKGLGPEMVMFYPQPTLFNKVQLVANNESSKRLGELLSGNAELQRLAAEFGFRTADGSSFLAAAKSVSFPVEPTLTQVVDPPSFDIMAEMINVITREMGQ